MAEPVGPQPLAWARAAVVGLAVGAYAAAGAQATESLTSGEPWNWGGMLARWAGYAVMGAVLNGLSKSGVLLSPEQRDGRAVVAAALRTGELPVGAAADAWRSRLASETRGLRQARWALLAASQLIATLVAVAAVAAEDPAPGVWALAVALSAFVAVPLRWLRVRMDRGQVLVTRLDA